MKNKKTSSALAEQRDQLSQYRGLLRRVQAGKLELARLTGQLSRLSPFTKREAKGRAREILRMRKNLLGELARCEELLAEGWNVLIFPEGTNFENAETLMPFKDGPARLVASTKLPIVPVHIKGVVHKSSEDKSFLPKRGKETEVVFGKPIYPGDMSVTEINAALRAAIEAL